jgi:REP-associated tyrosine transposase
MAAKQSLLRPPVVFNGVQARAIGRGFATSANKGGVTVWACAILPDHVHLVIARHTCRVERIVNCFKGDATRVLMADNLHPFQTLSAPPPHCWAVGQWKVFLDSVDDIRRAIQYVEQNPIKEGLRRQRWTFVTPYTV